MTREDREDAIDIIQSILDKYEEDECLVTEITIGDEDIKAFKMAIKALEQEPTTKNDLRVDCISRADAIGCLAGQIELSPSNVASVHEYLKCVNKRLHDLPSVTPQELCDKCEVGNPCLYCKHQYEPTTKSDLSSELEKNSKKLENPTKKYCGCCKHWKYKEEGRRWE